MIGNSLGQTIDRSDLRIRRWMFNVRRSMFDVRRSKNFCWLNVSPDRSKPLRAARA